MKEVLDDASDEYRRSPVGTYLGRATPAQYSRFSPSSSSRSVLFLDSPSSLRYRVRGETTLRDMWSVLQRRSDAAPSAFSIDPKIGAGRAGFVLGWHW